ASAGPRTTASADHARTSQIPSSRAQPPTPRRLSGADDPRPGTGKWESQRMPPRSPGERLTGIAAPPRSSHGFAMSSEPASAPPDEFRYRRLMHGLMVTVFAYGLWHLAWYWQTPLGQSPVLDERENLDLAAQIARGTLPPEPFYRAMLYPLILAVPFALGVPETLIPHMATLAGVLLHLIGTLFVH